MKFRFYTVALALILLSGLRFSEAGEVIDRIVATVNGQIILQSDWEEALRYEALVDQRSLDQVPIEDQKAALDHLIDQELLREQMRAADFHHATEDEIATKILDIRKQYPGADSDPVWQSILKRYSLTQGSLRARVASQVDLMRLVDARFRPSVNIDSKSIESYYNREIVPQLRQSGAKEMPLAEAIPQIKEVLTQQKMNELLVAWLQNLRSGSEIRTEPLDPRGSLQ